MESSQKLKKSYDHVIIGYNFASLMFARELAIKNQSFCLLDAQHIGNTAFKMIPSLDKKVFTRLPMNSLIDESKLSPLVGLWGEMSAASGPPLIFDKGQFKSFMGFGDHKVDSMDAVSYFCQVQYARFHRTPEEAWSSAEALVQEHLFLDQEITDISYHTGKVENVTLNGKTIVSGESFHFFDRLPFLFEKIGPEVKKLASQMGKLKWFSSVSLIIHHLNPPATFETDQLYLLKGAKEQACLGVFSRFGDEVISRWESYLPAELTVDPETTGMTLREIKKQVRRAFYQENTDSSDPEHIMIQNQVFADMEKADLKTGKVNNFNNLFVYTALSGREFGWAHDGYLGFHAAQVFVSSEKKDAESLIDVAAPSAPC